MRLPNNGPAGKPIKDRFSPQDVAFIQEWLRAVDQECPTIAHTNLHPPTLNWTAKLLDDDNQTTAPAKQAEESRTFTFPSLTYFARAHFYAGAGLATLVFIACLFILGVVLPVGYSLPAFLIVPAAYFYLAHYNRKKSLKR